MAPWLALGLVTLACAWPFLARFADFGAGQYEDYYPTLGLIADEDGWSSDPADWLLVRSNEHRVVLPMLLFRLDVALFDGDNRGLSAWSLLMLCATSLALVLLLPSELRRRDPATWTVAACAIVAFTWTTVAAQNIVQGMSGSFWLTADALAMSALAVASAGRTPTSTRRFVAALALATAASWTYSSGFMVWGALLLLVGLQGQGWRRTLAMLAGTAVHAAVAVGSYGRPGHLPEPNVGRDPLLLLDYVETFLGGLFARGTESAEMWGQAAWLGIAVVLTWLLRKYDPGQRHRRLWPWAAVLSYSVANAAVIAVGRSGFGHQQALSSRYGNLAALFWIGLLVPIVLGLADRHRGEATPDERRGLGRRWLLAAAALSILGLRLAGDRIGVERLDRFVERATVQPAALLALRHEIPDIQALEIALTPVPEQLWAVRSTLEALGHIPFDDDAPWPTGPTGPARDDPELGITDGVYPLEDGWVRVQGWLATDRPVAEGVVAEGSLGGAAGTILGPALSGSHRPDIAEQHGDALAFSGLIGYARTDAAATRPRLCVRFEDEPSFVCLPPTPKLERRWGPPG